MYYFFFLITPFYGCELWTRKKNYSFILKELSVCYHAVLKKILKIAKYSSNHFTCLTLNTLCFDNLLNFRQACFLHWLKNTKSPCFYRHRFYLFFNSFYKEHVCKLCDLNMMLKMFYRMMSTRFYLEFYMYKEENHLVCLLSRKIV